MTKTGGLEALQAARELGVSLHRTYLLIWDGKLTATKRDGRWLVDAEAVEARKQQRELALTR